MLNNTHGNPARVAFMLWWCILVFQAIAAEEPPKNYTLNDHFEGDALQPYWKVEGAPPKVAGSWVFMEPPGSYNICAPEKKQGYGIWEFSIKAEGEETGDVGIRLIDSLHNVQNAIALSISTIQRASFTAWVEGAGKSTEKVIAPCLKETEYKLKIVHLFDKVEFFVSGGAPEEGEDDLLEDSKDVENKVWTCTENVPAVELFPQIAPHAMRVDYVRAWRQ